MIFTTIALKILPKLLQEKYITKQMGDIDAGILTLVDKRQRLMQLIIALHPECDYTKNTKKEKEILLEKNEKTNIADQKLLELWGKIIELTGDTKGGSGE